MSRYRIEIRVTPRPGILDPQGKAVEHALHNLGWSSVDRVRVGKAIHIELDAASEVEARETADEMCRKLLANPVVEDYVIHEIALMSGATASSAGGAGA